MFDQAPAGDLFHAKKGATKGSQMLTLILIIRVLILLFGGGYGYSRRGRV
jgi:hypothetical protein